MTERIFVAPTSDIPVPNLDQGMGVFIKPEGELLADSIYLRRRIRDGSLKIGTPPPPADAAPAAKPRKP